eukprot:scaffold88613_cov60-Phaeocystis_antarctica.AAC.2
MWRASSRRSGSSEGESEAAPLFSAAPLFLDDSIPARSTSTSLPRRVDRQKASSPPPPARSPARSCSEIARMPCPREERSFICIRPTARAAEPRCTPPRATVPRPRGLGLASPAARAPARRDLLGQAGLAAGRGGSRGTRCERAAAAAQPRPRPRIAGGTRAARCRAAAGRIRTGRRALPRRRTWCESCRCRSGRTRAPSQNSRPLAWSVGAAPCRRTTANGWTGCSESSRRAADHFEGRRPLAGSAGRKRAQIRRESSFSMIRDAVGMADHFERRVAIVARVPARLRRAVRCYPMKRVSVVCILRDATRWGKWSGFQHSGAAVGVRSLQI